MNPWKFPTEFDDRPPAPPPDTGDITLRGKRKGIRADVRVPNERASVENLDDLIQTWFDPPPAPPTPARHKTDDGPAPTPARISAPRRRARPDTYRRTIVLIWLAFLSVPILLLVGLVRSLIGF